MAAFDYIALDEKGKRRKGVIEAETVRHARALLRERILTPIHMKTALEGRKSRFIRHIGLRDLSELTGQFALLVQSGLTVEKALQTLSRQSANPVVKNVLASVRVKVMEGETLSDSLKQFPGSFPEIFRTSVSAGERTGHLDVVLGQLAGFIDSAYQARQKIILALLYPFILTLVSILIIIFLMTSIVPDMIKIFSGTGQDLPLLTRGLIVFSDIISHYGLILLALIVAVAYGVRKTLSRPFMRLAFDKKLLHVPVIGNLALDYSCARLASTLGMLQESGVPLVQALDIAAAVITNRYLRRHVGDVTRKVSEGVSLSRAMEQAEIFTPVLVTMAGSGEASGKLGAMLMRAGVISQKSAEQRTAILIGVFEPAVLLMMGGIVLLLVLAVILPILNLNKLV